MGVVIGTACGGAEQVDPQPLEPVEKRRDLDEVDAPPGAIAAKSVAVRALRHRLPDPIGTRTERDEVEDAQPHADLEPGDLRPDPLDDLDEEPASVLERPAVTTGTIDGRKQLVTEIPVAMLEVDEPETRLAANRAASTKSSTSRAISSSERIGRSSSTPTSRSRNG